MSSSNRERTNQKFRAGRHITMGVLLFALGYILGKIKRFGTIELSTLTAYSLAGIMFIYGLFRIWRGIKDWKGEETDDFIT